MLGEPKADRRVVRHEATKAEILASAWELARAEGPAAITLRDIATRTGMKAPSLYGYFDSKHAVYDAMFAQAAQQFLDAAPWQEMIGDAVHDLRRMVHYFVRFCAEDVARYNLLFQRTIPGFEPSAESYAVAIEGLQQLGDLLARFGISDGRALDLFTALGTGLADQQISNDPGGERWIRLIDDAVEMFFMYITRDAPKAQKRERRKP